MATIQKAVQKHDEFMGALERAKAKGRSAYISANRAAEIKAEIFADANLKSKVKTIAEARGETITGLGVQAKAAKDMGTALETVYPDFKPVPPSPPEEPAEG